ncbi:MAG TPA: hypothetical protein VEP90_28610 [Methylomirabilota bacterium]|nr:hypothetical protein [Methylomirabilota bacterium]
MDINKTPYFYDYDFYETLDAAIEAATRFARKREESQNIYKAVAIVAPVESTAPVTVTIL